MPIMLLPEMASAFLKLGNALASWGRLGQIEEQLLRRARSAFMVKWFGTGVPTRGINLLINIDNIHELQERYKLVDRSRREGTRLNLFAPLAGIFGTTMGVIFNPIGGLAVTYLIPPTLGMFSGDGAIPITLSILWRIGAVVLGGPLAAIGGGLLIGLVAPLLLVVGLRAGFGGTPVLRAVYDLLGDAAMLVDAFLGFWDQITGPEDQIRNPLVRAVVRLLNRISALFIQIAGFISLIVVKLLPLIPWLVRQYHAARALIDAIIEPMKELFSGIWDAIKAPFEERGGIKAILMTVLDTLTTLPDTLFNLVTQTLGDAAQLMNTGFDGITEQISAWIDQLKDAIVEGFSQTPIGLLSQRIQNLLAVIPQVEVAFNAIVEPPPTPELPEPESSWLGDAWDWITESAADAALYGTLDEIENTLDAIDDIPIPPTPDITIPEFPTLPLLSKGRPGIAQKFLWQLKVLGTLP
ncbi:MAG: hypothetical protein AAFY42_11470, partial [Pseudomonadota bacterium]